MIAELLKKRGSIGKQKAMRAGEIGALIGKREREIVAAVRKERSEGVLICSDTMRGYYLPSCVEDVRKFIDIQEKRIKSHAVSIRAARQYIQAMKRGEI